MARYTLLLTAYRTGSDKTVSETPPLRHEVGKDPLAFKTLSQKGVQLQLDPNLVPDLVKGSCLRDYICAINPFYH